MPDKKYTIVESVGSAHENIHNYEDIEKHHPTWKEDPKKRHYDEIDGSREEFVYSPSGQQMVSKDIVLKVDGSSHVAVPSPVEGYVKRTDRWGMVEIYDQPNGTGNMIARVRHMEPVQVADGAHVAYGEPLGIQGGNNPNGKPFGTHAHIDIEVTQLNQFKQYIQDIDAGVIAPGKYPAKTPTMHYNGSQLEPVHKQSKADTTGEHVTLIASAESHTHRLFKEAGLDFANGGANTVASVTLLAAKHNITEIEHMNVKDGRIEIAQKDPSGFGYNTASIDAVQAANTDKEQSLQALNQLSEQQTLQVQQTQHRTQNIT